jgi:hypothetical protein
MSHCMHWGWPTGTTRDQIKPNHHIPDGRMQPASVRLVDKGWMRQLSFRLWRDPLGHFLAGILTLPRNASLADARLKKAGELLYMRLLLFRLVTHDVRGCHTRDDEL